jgi:hypothetical protein
MSHLRYEQDFYIPEDEILHSHRRENSKSYMLYYFIVDRFYFITQITCVLGTQFVLLMDLQTIFFVITSVFIFLIP